MELTECILEFEEIWEGDLGRNTCTEDNGVDYDDFAHSLNNISVYLTKMNYLFLKTIYENL